MKYIDAEKLIAEINNRLMSVNLEELGNFGCHRVWAYNDVKDLITSLQQVQESVAEKFARIVRENLTGINKEVQQKFEQLYFEITGTKMYGGYND